MINTRLMAAVVLCWSTCCGTAAETPPRAAAAADQKPSPPAAQLGAPEDMAFKAELDGSTQRYVRMFPVPFDPNKPCDVLIALHGHGSDRWQYVKADRGECKAARDFAAAHGMIYISPDYRASTSWMGPAAEADMVQLIALLRKQHKVRCVFLTGGSMGGTSVLIFAALHPDLVQGVSSVNGTANMLEYKSFQDAIAASYGGDKKQKPEQYRMRSPELVPEKLTMRVAFAVGGKDTLVPPDSVRRLAGRLQTLNPKGVLLLDNKDGGHSTSYEDTWKTLEFLLGQWP
jgi:dipeptidyl aminopeptidase/acylaminoacyl peptidase